MKHNKISYYRLFHACPNAPSVDVYLNNNLVAERLEYGQFTPYTAIPPGKYSLLVFPSGTSYNPLMKTELQIQEEEIYTVAITGLPMKPILLPIEDPKQPIPRGKLGLRFGNLSPTPANLNVYLSNGDLLFDKVPFKEVTDYIFLFPGKYTIEIVDADTDKTLLFVPNIVLKPDRCYSIYAIGLLDNQPYLQVVIPLDGSSYLNFQNWI